MTILPGATSGIAAIAALLLNSWRGLGGAISSPFSTSRARHDRNAALRIRGGRPAARHFEHRAAGVDAYRYLVAAVVLGPTLDGIAAGADHVIQIEWQGHAGL